jgi:diguanylate cyclase (GGDEF) domain
MNDDPHLWLQQSYPELQLHTYPDLPTALNALNEGDIFAVADTLPAMARGLGQNFFANLKISGQIEPNYTARFAMRAEDATLNQIMNKALMSVTDDQRESIGNRWMTAPTYAERTDYTLVGQITLATAFALVLILLWNRKLSRLNNTIRENNLQLLDAHEELKLKNRMLEQLSVTDRLTRLKNRLYIERIFDQEIARAEQGGQYDFAVLLLDIDHFKRINDHFGHAAGDATLTDFATILRGNCREHDVIARWGGEEFMVICPQHERRACRSTCPEPVSCNP